jgi:hypothetical protein
MKRNFPRDSKSKSRRRRANLAQSYYMRAALIVIRLDLTGDVATAIARAFPITGHDRVMGVKNGDRGAVYEYMHAIQVAAESCGARVTWEIVQ